MYVSGFLPEPAISPPRLSPPVATVSFSLHAAIESWQFLHREGVMKPWLFWQISPQPARPLPPAARQPNRTCAVTCMHSAAGGCHVDGSTATASLPLILISGKDGERPDLPETNGKCRNLQSAEPLRGKNCPVCVSLHFTRIDI